VPSKNLGLEFYDFDWYLRNEETIPGKKVGLRDMMLRQIASNELSGFTAEELRLLRNSIFAWHGFTFADKALEKYFSKFIWYSPSQHEQIVLGSVEKANVEMLLDLEKKN
jgi:hypothetical protein